MAGAAKTHCFPGLPFLFTRGLPLTSVSKLCTEVGVAHIVGMSLPHLTCTICEGSDFALVLLLSSAAPRRLCYVGDTQLAVH